MKMQEFDEGETRPSRPAKTDRMHEEGSFLQETQPVPAQQKPVKSGFSFWNNWRILWVVLAVVGMGLGSVTGGVAAYRSATETLKERQSFNSVLVLTEQFTLGLRDMEAGRYEAARQRFEFILSEDPDFPGALDKLVEVRKIIFATATPTPTMTATPTPTSSPTVTPTPTRDPRPMQELMSEAQSRINSGDWSQAIDLLIALRSTDPDFQTAQVDGLLYLSLRSRGLDRILNGRDLEGGAFDLSLAENFGPLDSQASWAQEMVRLYMYGSAFWEAYPEQAVYYFGQVASAAPYLTDATGWTSSARYRASLIHYGDYLATQEDWCSAQAQYELALSYGYDGDLEAKVEDAAYECSPPTATPTLEPTSTVTVTPEFVPSETPASTIPPEAPTATETTLPPTEKTPSQPATPTPTGESPAGDTPQPSETATLTPTIESPAATETSQP
jgi:tetratricopeptide (TPR) repeat protein